ncbi:MAG: alginate O-acetyltransferase complex protein AlgI [Candidatus Hydrogenedentes bacterium]|nr:alginate O-acetyltransferase complex protein AlgI [Candidatus Hydrogenedentota bacterium]
MVFTSHIFVFYFLPIVLLVYYALPLKRNFFLLCASYVFYGWWNPWFLLLMLFATAVNYVCGHLIAQAPVGSRQRYWSLVAAVVVSLSTLGFYKYFVFAQENLNGVLTFFGANALPVWQVTLPVGISFYIFQSLSYSIDVYRGDSPPVRSFSDFACFVALFPQLVAGPIVRYGTIADQLVERDHTLDKFASGIGLFILGFAKKILLANTVGEVADAVFAAESPYALDAWFGITAYAFQIYFDFSAYSDMAIGLGRMFGFEFPRNFDAPYRSASITEFWRRWHISLSTFLRDYLYVPLGGNRKGPRRTYINLAIVMLLGGLWHGANWTYVVWGGFHGALLAFERWRGKKSVYFKLPRALQIAVTFVLILFSWVLFRSPTIGDAGRFFAAMFGLATPHGGSALLSGEIYTQGHFIVMAVCALLAFQRRQAFDLVERLTWFKVAMFLVLFVLTLMTMFVQAFNPFLYFQF